MNIKKRFICIFAIFLNLVILSIAGAQSGSNVQVSGRVVLERNDTNDTPVRVPLPGLSVYLLSGTYGRSIVKITDNNGRFSFERIPTNGTPYFLEVYSDQSLIYRKEINISSDIVHEINLGRLEE